MNKDKAIAAFLEQVAEEFGEEFLRGEAFGNAISAQINAALDAGEIAGGAVVSGGIRFTHQGGKGKFVPNRSIYAQFLKRMEESKASQSAPGSSAPSEKNES